MSKKRDMNKVNKSYRDFMQKSKFYRNELKQLGLDTDKDITQEQYKKILEIITPGYISDIKVKAFLLPPLSVTRSNKSSHNFHAKFIDPNQPNYHATNPKDLRLYIFDKNNKILEKKISMVNYKSFYSLANTLAILDLKYNN